MSPENLHWGENRAETEEGEPRNGKRRETRF